jgi:hypothetical protein
MTGKNLLNAAALSCALTTLSLGADMTSAQVNAVQGSGLKQDAPALAATPAGGYVAAWCDERNGVCDIRAAVLDAHGRTLNPSAQANIDPHRRIIEEHPAIAADGSGAFVVVWRDNRAGGTYNIYARRFDSNGEPIGDEIKVDEGAPEDGDRHTPDVACDAAGNFIVVWMADETDDTIRARRFDSAGVPYGPAFRVDMGVEFAFTNSPAVAMSPAGAFTVAWIDVDIYFPEIFARAYAADALAPHRRDVDQHRRN